VKSRTPLRDDPLVRFATSLIQLIDQASTNSTYKYALAVALIDAAVENMGESPDGRGFVTTEELARRVIDLYWPHTRPWSGGAGLEETPRLRQLQVSGKSIVDRVAEATVEYGRQPTRGSFEVGDPVGWGSLLESVERILIGYPIPRLQRIGAEVVRLVYDAEAWPEKGVGLQLTPYFRARQRGEDHGGFDNRVRFLEGAEESLAVLSPLIRPLVIDKWVDYVRSRNEGKGQESLHDFLFGEDRISLAAVRGPLADLQAGLCFYCGEALGENVAVDHFVPWSRTGCDDLFNLVAAHAGCNSSKSDHLPASRHVQAWLVRCDRSGDAIHRIAREANWSSDLDRARRVVASCYWSAGGLTMLWDSKGRFELIADKILQEIRGQ
jgi:hypothetical protein